MTDKHNNGVVAFDSSDTTAGCKRINPAQGMDTPAILTALQNELDCRTEHIELLRMQLDDAQAALVTERGRHQEAERELLARAAALDAGLREELAEANSRAEAARHITQVATTHVAEYSLLMQEAITTMSHAEIFITSREKMHSTGVKLYGELLERMRKLVDLEPEQDCGNESARLEGGV